MKTIKVTYDNCRHLIGKEVVEKKDVLKLIDELNKYFRQPHWALEELKARIEG